MTQTIASMNATAARMTAVATVTVAATNNDCKAMATNGTANENVINNQPSPAEW